MTSRNALVVACVLLAVGTAVSSFFGDSLARLRATVALERPLREAIPTEKAGWVMEKEDDLREFEIALTKVDDYVSRLYRGPGGESVLLYVAYHGNKQRGLETLYHNASVCYPAAGWNLAAEQFGEITLHDAAKQLPICRYAFERESERLLVLTFFRVDDELLDQSPRNKPFWMLKDKMTPVLDDSPGTFVQVQLIVPVVADASSAFAAQEAFLQVFGTDIFQAIP